MLLSLLIPYRDRQAHLETLIEWFSEDRSYRGRVEAIVLELDRAPSKAYDLASSAGLRYEFIECAGVFHKTRALNAGLELARGELVTPFDVDLVPIADSLNRQLRAALALPQVLVTAYRLMSRQRQVQLETIDIAVAEAQIASEDGESALRKHLVRGERFGQVPMFAARDLKRLGGWDENFIGWGAEDQEAIERYVVASRRLFVRAPDFTYLHLFHEPAELWNEAELVQKNRDRHSLKRQELQPVGR